MRRIRAAATAALMIGLLLLVQWYIGWNGEKFVNAWTDRVAGYVYWPVYAAIATSYVAARLLRRVLPIGLHKALKWIGSYWFAVLQYGVLLLPAADLAAWLLREAAALSPQDSVRWAGCGFVLALGALLAAGSRNAWMPVVRRQTIVVRKQAGSLANLRIAVASDLHLGDIVGRRHLQRLVATVNSLEPDLVLLPGDVLDDDVEPFRRGALEQVIAGFRSTYGTFAILGNHEYYGGGIETYRQLMAGVGIPVLMDECVKVAESFYIIGRKDRTAQRSGGRQSAAALLEGVDRSKPVIMMDHQPGAIGEAAEAGVDLLLCGHTHRGQMAPNHLFTRKMFELDWGFMRKAATHVVVSSGYGTWGPPLRIGSRSEIWEITVEFQG